jgi:hypothetical protein
MDLMALQTAPRAEGGAYTGLLHAGAGTALLVVQLGALIPGLLPVVVLTVGFGAILLLPLVALTIVAGLLAAPAVGAWLLVRRALASRGPARRAMGPITRPSALPAARRSARP